MQELRSWREWLVRATEANSRGWNGLDDGYDHIINLALPQPLDFLLTADGNSLVHLGFPAE
jgi:hypothetical protein